jgi:hypothetical protein|tara:strand:+ start:4804 stop:5508 length:705 start_codon:yes stop_codon:yes gene_type:complete
MPRLERQLRKTINLKGNVLPSSNSKSIIDYTPSSSSMKEGEQIFAKEGNKPLALYKKNKGTLSKVYLSSNGNQIVDKKLTTNTLEYKKRFIDYRMFIHNFQKDLDTDELYLPWTGVVDTASLKSSTGYLTPFKMTCHKLIFRPPNLTDNTDNIVFAIKKIDNGDNTEDAVCNYTYSTTFVDFTSITIKQSDWSATPTINAGNVAILTIDASDTGITTSAMEFFITSVWRVEVEV